MIMKVFGSNNTKYGSNSGYYIAENIAIYVISRSVRTVKCKVWRRWNVPSRGDRTNARTPLKMAYYSEEEMGR
jgi:hypothetical protein